MNKLVVTADGPVLSSNQLAWPGILIEQWHVPAGENRQNASVAHAIGFHLSDPIQIYQRRDGHSQPHIFQTQDFCIIPAGVPNVCAQEQPINCATLNIDPALVAHTAETIGLPGGRAELLNNFGAHDRLITHTVLALLEEARSPGLGGRLFVESLANQLAVHLIRRYAHIAQPPRPVEGKLAPAQLKQVLDFIHSQLADDLSLAQMAAAVHLTPYHFARLFKQSTGLSPHQYLIAQRVQTAMQMLSNPTTTIAEIAQQVGFADQSHLTRHFKRRIGVSPRAFQRQFSR